MTPMRYRRSTTYLTAFVVLALCALVVGPQASATLIAFEDFNYTPIGADLNGKSGGGSFGFSDAWTGNTSYNIGNGSLVSPTGSPSSGGNSMTTVAYQENRDLDRHLASPIGQDDTTVYISFLVRPEGILNQGYANGWFALALRGSTDIFAGMTYPTNRYGLTVGFEDAVTNQLAVVGQTKLLVIRIDFTEGIDTTRFYINPIGNEPAIADASLAFGSFNNITRISLTGPGANSLDAIRIGTTWTDVVPEPSTYVLATIGVVALLAFKRRKR